MSAHKNAASSSTQDLAQQAHDLSPEEYADLFRCMDKEALATIIAALFVTIAFWGAIFLTHSSALTFFSMPLWFLLSCIGGYLLSVVTVIVLVKCCMHNLTLNIKSCKEHDHHE